MPDIFIEKFINIRVNKIAKQVLVYISLNLFLNTSSLITLIN